MRIRSVAIVVAALAASSALGAVRPVPRPALKARLAEGIDLIGIVHWGLNTYTDREWALLGESYDVDTLQNRPANAVTMGFAFLEHANHVLVLRQMSHHPQFDLAVVS